MASNQRSDAQRLWQEAKQHLIQMLQPGNPRAFAHGIKRSSLNHRSPVSNVGQGLSFLDGRMPTDADITAFAEQNPVYRAAIQRENRSRRQDQSAQQPANQTLPVEPGGVAGGASGELGGPEGLAGQAIAQAVGYQNQANAYNEARYGQMVGGQQDLAYRRQGRAANWGIAASKDIDERLQNALSDAKANAADRGLANSNVVDAYRMRASRDTAREQQRVSEMRDDRMNQYDAQDTGNLLGMIERRTDAGPDMSQLMGLLSQYGAGGGGVAGSGVGGGMAPQAPGAPYTATGPGQGYQPRQANGGGIGGMPIWQNGDPMDVFQRTLPGLAFGSQPQVGVVSNSYPMDRPLAPKGNKRPKTKRVQGGPFQRQMVQTMRDLHPNLPAGFTGQIPAGEYQIDPRRLLRH